MFELLQIHGALLINHDPLDEEVEGKRCPCDFQVLKRALLNSVENECTI